MALCSGHQIGQAGHGRVLGDAGPAASGTGDALWDVGGGGGGGSCMCGALEGVLFVAVSICVKCNAVCVCVCVRVCVCVV